MVKNVRKPKPLAKSAYDKLHKIGVRAWTLHADVANGGFAGDCPTHAGKLVSVAGSGGRVLVTLNIWAGPLKSMPSTTGAADGYGYCKFSAAFADAVRRGGMDCHNVDSAGVSSVQSWLRAAGYTIAEAV